MNEKEMKKYDEKLESWMSLSGDAKDKCIYRYPVDIRIQADIARQLTRIADQMQNKDDVTFCKGFGKGLETGRAQRDTAPQTGLTTDALVEAVEKIIGTIRLAGHDGNCGRSLCPHCEIVTALKDAHEKAVQ